MENADLITVNDKPLRFAALVYSTILLVAMCIGMYGLFSLLWLANASMERASAAGSLLH